MSEHQPVAVAGYRRVVFPVDSARFVVLHPLDFRKRLRDEGGTLLELVAAGDLDEELEAGQVFGLELGSGGSRAVYVGPHPAPAELAAALGPEPPFDFRLHVSRNGVFVGDPTHEDSFRRRDKVRAGASASAGAADNDDGDDGGDDDGDAASLYVPAKRGRYHGRLYAVAAAERARLATNWVITLEPVDDFEYLPAWRGFPHEDAFGAKPEDRPRRGSGPTRFVKHPKFGVGRVLHQEGEGASAKLHVAFEVGEKRLLASFVTEAEGEGA